MISQDPSGNRDDAIEARYWRIEESEVHAMLGTIDQVYLYDLLEAILQKNGTNILNIAYASTSKILSFIVTFPSQELQRETKREVLELTLQLHTHFS